jgi:hypothetical protein
MTKKICDIPLVLHVPIISQHLWHRKGCSVVAKPYGHQGYLTSVLLEHNKPKAPIISYVVPAYSPLTFQRGNLMLVIAGCDLSG